jgi:cytochrome c oxidase assembly protein subunit 20
MVDELNSKQQLRIEHLLRTPCYRSSLLFGIGGGIGSGLLFFLFTSKIRLASHVGVVSYAGISVAAWSYCRYQMAEADRKQREYRVAIQQKLLIEGTELGTKFSQSQTNSDNVTGATT